MGFVIFMPLKIIPQPYPHSDNPDRRMTLHLNGDCPRCGHDCHNCYEEPGEKFHCPACHGAVTSEVRMEDGGKDRSKDVNTFGWLAPCSAWVYAEPCGCGGCEVARSKGGT